jgi:hypothetical protein
MQLRCLLRLTQPDSSLPLLKQHRDRITSSLEFRLSGSCPLRGFLTGLPDLLVTDAQLHQPGSDRAENSRILLAKSAFRLSVPRNVTYACFPAAGLPGTP